VTIAVLVLISRNATLMRLNVPASLGQPFVAGG
jgi:simple sugar transport system permease protein